VNEHGPLPESVAQGIFCEILSAVDYIHRSHVVHRDLKLENIMITKDFHVKLIDFGLAYQPSEQQIGLYVTYPYTASELFRGLPHDDSIDIWSLGVILYSVICGRLPFVGNAAPDVIYRICHSEPFYPDSMSLELSSLHQGMFQKDPILRVTIKEIANHPWVRSSHNFSVLGSSFTQILEGTMDLPRPDNPEGEDLQIDVKQKNTLDTTITRRLIRWRSLELAFT
jgi:serine/threonine protein kinase